MKCVLLDTNLLVLLVVGTASRSYISKHKKLSSFSEEYYDLLLKFLYGATSIVATTNIWTETSNLISYISEPAKSRILQIFRQLISELPEKHVPSAVACERNEFFRLGLVDAATLEAAGTDYTVLTTDLGLYLAALKTGDAVNFNHFRDQNL